MMLYTEVHGINVRAAMRRLNIYYNNSNKKHIVGKHNRFYVNKVMKWYEMSEWQAEWLVEHYINTGYMYMMDEDINAATTLGYMK